MGDADPGRAVVPDHGDPAEIAAVRDSVRLAFVTALQHLPARQRAALILCEVLAARGRGRQVLDSRGLGEQRAAAGADRARRAARAPAPAEVEPENAELLARYVDAFQRYDMKALVGLLREDALQTMPPFEMWMQGDAEIPRGWCSRGRARAPGPC